MPRPRALTATSSGVRWNTSSGHVERPARRQSASRLQRRVTQYGERRIDREEDVVVAQSVHALRGGQQAIELRDPRGVGSCARALSATRARASACASAASTDPAWRAASMSTLRSCGDSASVGFGDFDVERPAAEVALELLEGVGTLGALRVAMRPTRRAHDPALTRRRRARRADRASPPASSRSANGRSRRAGRCRAHTASRAGNAARRSSMRRCRRDCAAGPPAERRRVRRGRTSWKARMRVRGFIASASASAAAGPLIRKKMQREGLLPSKPVKPRPGRPSGARPAPGGAPAPGARFRRRSGLARSPPSTHRLSGRRIEFCSAPPLPRWRRNRLSTIAPRIWGRGQGLARGGREDGRRQIMRKDIFFDGSPSARRWPLAGCETISPMANSPRVAEVEDDPAGSQAINIAFPVRGRHPQSERSRRPTIRAAPPMRAPAAIARRSPISTRRSSSIPISPPLTPTAASPIARPIATTRRWRISPAPSRSIPTMARPISPAPTCCACRTTSSPPSRISTRRSGSIRKTRRPSMRAACSISARTSISSRFPISTRRSIAIPYAAAPYQARGQSLIATSQFEKAVEDFNAALNVDNRNGDAWAGRGLAYERLGKRQEASESYQRALTADPGNAMARAGNSRLGGGFVPRLIGRSPRAVASRRLAPILAPARRPASPSRPGQAAPAQPARIPQTPSPVSSRSFGRSPRRRRLARNLRRSFLRADARSRRSSP